MRRRVSPLREISRTDPVGVIYVIQSVRGGPVKIGWVSKPLGIAKRLGALQVGNPDLLRVIWTTPGSQRDESWLHAEFRLARLRGEWFEATAAVVERFGALSEDRRGQPQEQVEAA